MRISWQRKQGPELQKVARELESSKVGRKVRLAGGVEEVTTVFALGPIPPLKPDTLQRARTVLPGYDIYGVEAEWRSWAAGKDAPPDNPDAAFIAFCKKYGKNNPL